MMTFGRYWLVLSSLPSLFFMVVNSIDTLAPNQSLRDGELLVSAGETFALGFFGSTTSNHRYVGIWYHKISIQTIVWVANRETPLNGTSGVLSFNQDGYIFINDIAHNVTVWQTNVDAAKLKNSNYSMQLLDSGNLILFKGHDASFVVWQSFDYPSNTMLPNMKLGLDRRTGFERFLTSWKSIDDPSPGEHSMRIEVKGLPQLVLQKGTFRSWRSGPWIGGRFSGIPEMTPYYNSYVDNDDEVSLEYGFISSSMLVRVFVDELGFGHRQIWDKNNGKWVQIWFAPKYSCDHYGHCGSYGNCDPSTGAVFECTCLPGYEPRSTLDWHLRNGTGGCVRKHRPVGACDNGDRFLKLTHAKLPDVSQARYFANLSPERCQETCLKNCSCTAYTTGGEVECITWHGDLNDSSVLPTGGQDLYVRVDTTELAQQSNKAKSSHGKEEAIIVGSIAVVFLLIICLVYWLVSRKRREARLNMLQASEEHNLELPFFDFATIVWATNNFSIENKIGEGGFGPVYKGYLSTKKEIAVKRLSTNSRQGVNEFKNEVILIAKLQHRNLVRLLGCCIHQEERMLVYEYMPNGSLDSFIFGLEDKKYILLTWRRRLDIIIGIARGLLYLHQDSRFRVIHRDLKISNILLDSEMNPKISDFGLAKVVGEDQSLAITRRVVGTYGYMSPEYVIDGVFSTKLDVFSFGVIILEILTGQRNRLFRHPEHDLNLLGHAWKLWAEGKALEILDPLGEGSTPIQEILRCVQVGLLCVQKKPEDRPNMSYVLLMLTSETKLPQPKQPGFYMERKNDEHDHNLSSKGNSSINEMTTTHVEAR